MSKARRVLMLSSLLLLVPVAGCWDRVEIENVGIVLGIGLDLPAKENSTKTMPDEQRLSMIHHFAIPKRFAAKEGGLAVKNYVNLTSEGNVVFDNIKEVSTRVSRIPSYEHLAVIVISEDVARTLNMQNMINFLLRNTEARRSIRVVISDGKVNSVFEKQGLNDNPALKLRGMADEFNRTLLMTSAMKVGDMSANLSGKNSFVIQRVVTFGKESKISGAAVISGKKAKMVGLLDEMEVVGLNWLRGERKEDGIVKGIEPKSGAAVVYEVRNIKRTVKPKVEGDNISFDVMIQSEGRLREDWVIPGNALDEDFVKRAEQAAELSVKESVEKTLAKIQKDLKTDVAGFGKKLEIKYPQVWKRVKDNWDTEFGKASVNVSVKMQITEYGTRGTKKG